MAGCDEIKSERDRGSRGKRCACRHAYEAWVCQRVAEKPLHQGARGGQCRTDEQAQKQSWQAHLQNDERVASRREASCQAIQENGENTRDRNARGAEAQGNDTRQDKRSGERSQPQGLAVENDR